MTQNAAYDSILRLLPAPHPAPLELPVFVFNLNECSRLPTDTSDEDVFAALLPQIDPYVSAISDQTITNASGGEEDKALSPSAAKDGKAEGSQRGEGYVLVVLCSTAEAGGRSVGPTWLLRHLARLERKYRKGLKRLYLVHASSYTATLLPIISTFVSPKFLSKIRTVPSLSALVSMHRVSLAGYVLSLADLEAEHAAVQAAKAPAGWGSWLAAPLRAVGGLWSPVVDDEVIDSQETSRAQAGGQKGYWGRNAAELELVLLADATAGLLEELKSAILSGCTGAEGIFRKTSHAALRPTLIALLDLPVHLQPTLPWHAIAASDTHLPPKMVLRLYSSMSEPLIPSALYEAVCQTSDLPSIKSDFLPLLPAANRALLLALIDLFHALLPHREHTRMSALNLAIVAAPDLIKGPDPVQDLRMCMEKGKKLPAGLGGSASTADAEDAQEMDGGNTLVGMLETMIREWTG